MTAGPVEDVEVQEALVADLRRRVERTAAGKATAADRKVLEQYLASQAPEQVAEAPAGDFKLEADPVDELPAMTQKEVAAAYGYSLRQVKNWCRDGRKAGMACPFRRPALMPAWFEAVYAPRECPERLLGVVGALRAGERSEPVAEARSSGGPRVVTESDLVEVEVGFEATLNRALRREALLDLRLRQAIEGGDPRADALETQWGKAAARVRELEKAAPAILEAQGVYVRRADVKEALLEVAGVLPKGIRQALRGRWHAIRSAESIDAFDAEVSEGLAAALQGLCESRFAVPLELQVAG